MTKLAFVDTETTGLDRVNHNVWEIAIITRDTEQVYNSDSHWVYQLPLDMVQLQTADPTALKINKFYERYSASKEYGIAEEAGTPYRRSAFDMAEDIAHRLDQVTFVAAVPDFDAWFIQKFLNLMGLKGTWHYHLVCVENLAAGRLQKPPPWKSSDLYQDLGIIRAEEDAHTALGDAKLCRDVYDVVMKGR